MAFADDQAKYLARLAAVAPYLAQNPDSVVALWAGALLSYGADIQTLLTATAQNITYTTATGPALAAKAQEFNVSPNLGQTATANVVLYLQVAAGALTTIPVGFTVSTGGDGITQPAVFFQTTAPTTIAAGATNSGAPTPVQCTVPGVIGNVAAGTIVATALGSAYGVLVSNASSVNGLSNPNGAGVGGVNADSDAQIRAKIARVATPLNGAANLTAAALAVPGVYDAYIHDPAASGAPTGYFQYYWCALDGTSPTISGGSLSSGIISGATLTSTALAIDTAIRAAAPLGTVAQLGGAGSVTVSFLVNQITALSVQYTTSKNNQQATIEPLIQAAIIAYIQQLLHNQIPAQSPMFLFVNSALGNILYNFTWSAVTYTPTGGASSGSVAPTTLTGAQTTIYRAATPTITLTGTFI